MTQVAFHAPLPDRARPSLDGVRVYLESLGCAKNLVDSEATLGLLAGSGCRRVRAPEEADVLLLNTCGFLEQAREESIDRILELAQFKSIGTARLLGVLGCLVSRAPDELREAIPEVDVWLPAGGHGEVAAALERHWQGLPDPAHRRAADRSGSDRAPVTAFAGFGARVLLTPTHTAYLKIAEGCSNTCSFCSIPSMRGTQRSRPLSEVVAEARGLAARGVRELHLVAQDLTQYGFDLQGRPDLVDLATELATVEGLEWIRLLYAHPAHLTRRMVDELFAVPKVVPYLDMPIQHASDRLLRAMRRPYSGARVRALCAALRARVPEITLRTTLIVGFPGETERDFEQLCRFVSEVEFDRLGIFTFSREPGTPAAALPGRPRASTAMRRMQTLVELQMHIAGRRAAARLGRTVEVLVDGPVPAAERGHTFAAGARAVGRSAAEALDIDGCIFLEGPAGELVPGTFVAARVTAADVHDLRAVVVPARPRRRPALDLTPERGEPHTGMGRTGWVNQGRPGRISS